MSRATVVRSPSDAIVTRPPNASTRSCGARRSRSQVALRDDLERERALLTSDAHHRRSAGRRALQRVEHAEVDGAGDLGGTVTRTSTSIRTGTPSRLAAARSSGPARPRREAKEDPVASSCISVNARRASCCSSSRSALAAAGSDSTDRAATSRLAASPPGPAARPRGGPARCRDVRHRRPARVVSETLGAPRSRGATHRGLAARRSGRSPAMPWVPASCPSSLGRRRRPARYRAGMAASALARPPP